MSLFDDPRVRLGCLMWVASMVLAGWLGLIVGFAVGKS